jgi:hypothetical protein
VAADEPNSSDPSPSPYAGLSKWQPRPEPPEPEVLFECQSCHEPRPFTRPYWVPTIIFAVFLTVYRWEHYVYCPPCMRRHLAFYLIPNMLVATVAAPAVLVLWAWVFFTTFSRRRYVAD